MQKTCFRYLDPSESIEPTGQGNIYNEGLLYVLET